MKTHLLCGALLLSSLAQAQYYYKDIIGTKETTAIIKTYVANKVGKVLVNTYDADGNKSTDVYVEQQFSVKDLRLKTITRSDEDDQSILTSFADAEGRVIKTIDSSQNLVTTTLYQYDVQGKLSLIAAATIDAAKGINEREEHQWKYSNNNITTMLRIKNGTDTAYVSFKLDAAGNVSEEQSLRKGIKSDPVYYYYDAQNRLTDIVRYNKTAGRLLPDYMFEYDIGALPIKMTTIAEGGRNYFIWRYAYTDHHLPEIEKCYSKEKRLLGTIQYEYQSSSD